jgi:hypothetical protein
MKRFASCEPTRVLQLHFMHSHDVNVRRVGEGGRRRAKEAERVRGERAVEQHRHSALLPETASLARSPLVLRTFGFFTSNHLVVAPILFPALASFLFIFVSHRKAWVESIYRRLLA